MNERIYNLARQAEQHAREHVRDCEYYGYTMIEGTAEDEFHAEFRYEFAKLIIKECFSLVESCALVEAAVPETYLGESLNVAMRITDVGHKIKEHFGVEE